MADYTPISGAGFEPFPATAGAAITGGQLVYVTADKTVSPTSATTQRAVGVAASDAPSGGRVTVWPLPDVLHESTNNNAGTLVVGDAVIAGASAGVDWPAGADAATRRATAAAAGTFIGICVKAAATGAKAQWVGV